MFRKKKKDDGNYKEYYVIPGGGVELNETLEDACIRELKEEYNVDISVLGYLGYEETETTISHFFHAQIINEIPTLGGPESERNNQDNYYEIRKVNIEELEKTPLYAKEFVKKAYKNEYISIK